MSGNLGNPATQAPASDALGELFRNLPLWLTAQLESCRENPERLLNPTASAISTKTYGRRLSGGMSCPH